MRKTLRASVLIFALSGSALAGDMSNPSTPQPPPSNMTVEEKATDSESQTEAADSFTEMLLSVLEIVLALR